VTAEAAPWQPRELASVFGVDATARRIGTAMFVEESLFALLGGWVRDTTEVAVKERLAAHSHRHAAHVALWRDRLPRATGIDGAAMVTSPASALDDAFVVLASPADTLRRLAGVYRVMVPRLVAAYTYQRNVTNAVTDSPTVTVLEVVIADLVAAGRDGELMIETLLSTAADVDAAARHQADVERAIVAAGGVFGSGTLG
jgi:hypothetical protein